MRLQTATFDFANKARTGFVEFTTAHERTAFKFKISCTLELHGKKMNAVFYGNKTPNAAYALRLLKETNLPF